MAAQWQEIADLVGDSVGFKFGLLEFAQDSRFQRHLREAARGFGRAAENPIAVLEYFVLEHRFEDGTGLLDRYVAERRELTGRQREFLLGWKRSFHSLFELTGRDEHGFTLLGVLDELEYRVYSNAGAEIYDHLPDGSFLAARLVPLGQAAWLLSGDSQGFDPEQRDFVLDAALELAQKGPELVYRNSVFLERAWAAQREERAVFLDHFQTELLTVPMDQVEDVWRQYMETRNEKLMKSEPAEITRANREMPDFGFAKLAPGARTLTFLYDEIDGLSLSFDFHEIEAIFADPALLDNPKECAKVISLLRDGEANPAALRHLAERDPETATRVLARVTGNPKFTWPADGGDLIAKHKPALVGRDPLPRVLVLGERLSTYNKEREQRA